MLLPSLTLERGAEACWKFRGWLDATTVDYVTLKYVLDLLVDFSTLSLMAGMTHRRRVVTNHESDVNICESP